MAEPVNRAVGVVITRAAVPVHHRGAGIGAELHHAEGQGGGRVRMPVRIGADEWVYFDGEGGGLGGGGKDYPKARGKKRNDFCYIHGLKVSSNVHLAIMSNKPKMFRHEVPIASGHTLILIWEAGWRNILLIKDQKVIGRFANLVDLYIGRECVIPGIGIGLVRLGKNEKIEVIQNGKDLAEQYAVSQRDYFATGWQVLYGMAALATFLYVISISSHLDLIYYFIAIGIISGLLGLGYTAQRYHVVWPLWTGAALTAFFGYGIVFFTKSLFIFLFTSTVVYLMVRGAKKGPLTDSGKHPEFKLTADSPLDADIISPEQQS